MRGLSDGRSVLLWSLVLVKSFGEVWRRENLNIFNMLKASCLLNKKVELE